MHFAWQLYIYLLVSATEQGPLYKSLSPPPPSFCSSQLDVNIYYPAQHIPTYTHPLVVCKPHGFIILSLSLYTIRIYSSDSWVDDIAHMCQTSMLDKGFYIKDDILAPPICNISHALLLALSENIFICFI